jgi:putative serine protease PepD
VRGKITIPYRLPIVRVVVLVLLLTVVVLLSACTVEIGGPNDSGQLPQPSRMGSPSAEAQAGDPGTVPANPVAAVLGSVVEVQSTSATDSYDGLVALGTGVVYNGNGVVVTADHVVTSNGKFGSSEITVTLADGSEHDGEVLARFPDRDLAFIATQPCGCRPPQFLEDYEALDAGARVYAIGAPQRFGDPAVRGRVLSVRTDIRIPQLPGLDALVETDAQLRQGYSGGPLIDSAGRIVGVNIAVNPGPPGPRTIGFAVPAPVIVEAAEQVLPGQ